MIKRYLDAMPNYEVLKVNLGSEMGLEMVWEANLCGDVLLKWIWF